MSKKSFRINYDNPYVQVLEKEKAGHSYFRQGLIADIIIAGLNKGDKRLSDVEHEATVDALARERKFLSQ
jgi:hypothetical protein